MDYKYNGLQKQRIINTMNYKYNGSEIQWITNNRITELMRCNKLQSFIDDDIKVKCWPDLTSLTPTDRPADLQYSQEANVATVAAWNIFLQNAKQIIYDLSFLTCFIGFFFNLRHIQNFQATTIINTETANAKTITRPPPQTPPLLHHRHQ